MAITSELSWASMTAAINNIDSPNTFLQKLLFSNHKTNTTETIEIDTWVRGRKMAPLITKNASAVPVDGPTKTRAIVEAPMIRIKREIDPADVLFARTPGSIIFPSRGAQSSAIREHIAKELQPLADDITNTIEWMCAQAIRGVITYSNDKFDSFTIDYQKSAGNTVVLGTTAVWTHADAEILVDIHTAKRVVHKATSAPITDALCSETAADAFLGNAAIKTLLDQRNVTAGEMTFIEQFTDDGVIYLGKVGGVRFWEYGRAVDNDGTSEDLIRAGYVEFTSRSAMAEQVLNFGAITDMEAFESGKWVAERFSKSKVNFDPPTITGLATSRPLPVMRRPDSTYSLKVV